MAIEASGDVEASDARIGADNGQTVGRHIVLAVDDAARRQRACYRQRRKAAGGPSLHPGQQRSLVARRIGIIGAGRLDADDRLAALIANVDAVAQIGDERHRAWQRGWRRYEIFHAWLRADRHIAARQLADLASACARRIDERLRLDYQPLALRR